MITNGAVTIALKAASSETFLTGQSIESINAFWRSCLAVSLDTMSPDRRGRQGATADAGQNTLYF